MSERSEANMVPAAGPVRRTIGLQPLSGRWTEFAVASLCDHCQWCACNDWEVPSEQLRPLSSASVVVTGVLERVVIQLCWFAVLPLLSHSVATAAKCDDNCSTSHCDGRCSGESGVTAAVVTVTGMLAVQR